LPQECIFPAEKLVSPVADALRKTLADVNWARAGLGMPLLEERSERVPHLMDVPAGPRPAPEGESMSMAAAMSDGRAGGVHAVQKETLIQVFFSIESFYDSRTQTLHISVFVEQKHNLKSQSVRDEFEDLTVVMSDSLFLIMGQLIRKRLAPKKC
jgi:hypothetical protein